MTVPGAPQTPVSADAVRLNDPARQSALSGPAASQPGQPLIWNTAASFWPQVLASQPDLRRGAASSTHKSGSDHGSLAGAAAPEGLAATDKPGGHPLPGTQPGPHLPFAARPRPDRDAEPANGAPQPTPPSATPPQTTPPQPEPPAPTVAPTPRHFADERQPAPLSTLAQPAPGAAGPLHAHHGVPRNLPETLAKAAKGMTRNEPTELLLDPAELGKVRFELTTTGDRVQVNLSVERADTLDLLRRNMDILRAEFRDAGFDAATLTFGQWGKDHEDAAPSDPSQIPEDDLVTPDHAAPPSHGHNPSDQGLHLRL